MKQILSTTLLVVLLTLTIFAFNQTHEPGKNTPVTSVTSARVTE